jgi:hypothetical protein
MRRSRRTVGKPKWLSLTGSATWFGPAFWLPGGMPGKTQKCGRAEGTRDGSVSGENPMVELNL